MVLYNCFEQSEEKTYFNDLLAFYTTLTSYLCKFSIFEARSSVKYTQIIRVGFLSQPAQTSQENETAVNKGL